MFFTKLSLIDLPKKSEETHELTAARRLGCLRDILFQFPHSLTGFDFKPAFYFCVAQLQRIIAQPHSEFLAFLIDRESIEVWDVTIIGLHASLQLVEGLDQRFRMDLTAWAESICKLSDCVIDGTQLGRRGDLAEIGSPAEALAFEYAPSDPQVQLPLAVGQGALLIGRSSGRCQFVPVCREDFGDRRLESQDALMANEHLAAFNLISKEA